MASNSPSEASHSVHNMNIAQGCEWIILFLHNILADASMDQIEVTEHMIGRLLGYCDYLDNYVKHCTGDANKVLDLTGSYPYPRNVRECPNGRIDAAENLALKGVCQHWQTLFYELLTCASKDRASGLSAPDLERYKQIMTEIRSLIQHIKDTPVVDLPETVEPLPPPTAS